MKHLFLLTIIIGAVIAGCTGNDAKTSGAGDPQLRMNDSANYTTAAWKDSVQSFGQVVKGKQVQILFHVMNTGSKPLFITHVQPTCGCTVADFTKSAIAPGASGEVTANFDSNHGRAGTIHKTIDVTSNTNPTHTTLVFEGEVTEATK